MLSISRRFQNLSIRLALATAIVFGAGCSKPAEVPRYDFSKSTAYATEEFKDDAPANASVDKGGFPEQFSDFEGRTVDLAEFRGKKKVVLIVLRGMPQSEKGAFCPTCLAQTSALLANREEFEKKNVEILVMFPGPADRLGEFLEKARKLTPGEPIRAYRVLLDRECSVCNRLGIRDDLAKPSTYILDTRGDVVYAYIGATSTDRPSVKAILSRIDRAD